MEYLLYAALVFFVALYVACSYLIFRFVTTKNPGIYTGLSGIKKMIIMLLMPILAIVMAGIQFASETKKDNSRKEQ